MGSTLTHLECSRPGCRAPTDHTRRQNLCSICRAPLLARYQTTLAAFTRGAQEFCTRRGMHYMLANNKVPIGDVVGHHLRRRGLVR